MSYRVSNPLSVQALRRVNALQTRILNARYDHFLWVRVAGHLKRLEVLMLEGFANNSSWTNLAMHIIDHASSLAESLLGRGFEPDSRPAWVETSFEDLILALDDICTVLIHPSEAQDLEHVEDDELNDAATISIRFAQRPIPRQLAEHEWLVYATRVQVTRSTFRAMLPASERWYEGPAPPTQTVSVPGRSQRLPSNHIEPRAVFAGPTWVVFDESPSPPRRQESASVSAIEVEDIESEEEDDNNSVSTARRRQVGGPQPSRQPDSDFERSRSRIPPEPHSYPPDAPNPYTSNRWVGVTHYTVEELCEVIRANPHLASRVIADLYRREIPSGVRHEFIVVRSLELEGHPNISIRLDRAAMGYRQEFHWSSRYPADDKAQVTSTENSDAIIGNSRLRAHVNFETSRDSPKIFTLGELLAVILKVSTHYHVTPSNCWFFTSVIQQILTEFHGGRLVSGRLGHARVNPELRRQIREQFANRQQTTTSREPSPVVPPQTVNVGRDARLVQRRGWGRPGFRLFSS